MDIKKEAISFIKHLQKLYLEDRDPDALYSHLDVEITWIGTGENETCFKSQDIRHLLMLEKQALPTKFIITDTNLEATLVCEHTVIIFGDLYAYPEDQSFTDIYYRFSTVCTKKSGSFKLCHLHISCPNENQQPGEFFVKKETKDPCAVSVLQVKRATEQLRNREQELAILTQNIPGGAHRCLTDEGFTLINMSDSFLKMTGYTAPEIKEKFHNHFLEMIVPEDRVRMREEIEKQLLTSEVIEVEYRIERKDGAVLWLLDKGKLMKEKNGIHSFYCILVDITTRKQQQEELRLSLERHQLILNQTRDIIFEWDILQDKLFFSSNWRKKFGYDPIDVKISKRIPLSSNIHPDDISAFIKIMKDTAAGVPYSEAQFRVCDSNKKYSWQKIRATTQYDNNGKAIKAIGVIVDIDSEKKQTQRLMDEVQRDALTGLFNKTATQELTADFLAGSDCHHGSLLIIDVDDFKQINDQYGHFFGDSVLAELASSIKKQFRSTDIIGRIGGDEFLIFLPCISREKTKELGELLLEKIRGLTVNGKKNILSCSMGSAFYPTDGDSFLNLYKSADMALYYAKKHNKGGFQSYSADAVILDDFSLSPVQTAVNAEIDSDVKVDHQIAQYSFLMLYHAVDIKKAISHIMEIIGKSCDVSRVYIFENSEDNLYCSNTFEWCAEGVEPQIDFLQNLSYAKDLCNVPSRFSKEGILYCKNIDELGPNLSALLARQSIKAILQCAIMDDGVFRGCIGFDECKQNRVWTKEQVEMLTITANVISTFLLKLRLKEKLHALLNLQKQEETLSRKSTSPTHH